MKITFGKTFRNKFIVHKYMKIISLRVIYGYKIKLFQIYFQKYFDNRFLLHKHMEINKK